MEENNKNEEAMASVSDNTEKSSKRGKKTKKVVKNWVGCIFLPSKQQMMLL